MSAAVRMKLEKYTAIFTRFTPFVLFVLVLALAWVLASVLWLFLAPPSPPVVRFIPLSPIGQNVPNIANYPLFKPTQAVQPTSAATPIPLHLDGVFTNVNRRQAAALIRANNVTKHYRVGKVIEGTQLILTDVKWNKVFLQGTDQARYVLKFGQDAVEPIASAQSGMNPAVNTGLPSGQTAATLPNGLSSPQNAVAGQAVEQQLANASTQLASNPNAYLSQMGLMPTGQGYEITPQTPDQLRAKIGLQPGDKILSINGKMLGSPVQDAQLLEQVRQTRQAQIEVQRGAQTLTIQQSF